MRPRTATVAALGLALALSLPSLGVGYFSDDYTAVAVLEGRARTLQRPPFDLYRFESGRAADMARMQSLGPTPWWSLPTLRLGFFRPLSSALLALDHAFFGPCAPLAHAHSIAWLLALVLVATRVLYRALPPELAGVAALLYASRASHWMTVGWISNRHALVSVTFALLALELHLRHRASPSRHGALGAPLALCFALAGGESALGVYAFLLASECARADSLRSRALALAPSLFVGFAYAVLSRALGYGAAGSGFYIDPRADPLRFGAALVARAPCLVGELLTALPSDLWAVAPRLRFVLPLFGLVAGLGFAALLARAWRTLSPEGARALRWMLPATLLSIVPLASAAPSGRLLTLPALGASAALAALIGQRRARGLPQWSTRAIAALAVVHGALSPPAFFAAEVVLSRASARFERVVDEAPWREGRDALLIVSDPLVSMHTGAALRARGLRPGRWRVLSMAPCDHGLTRTGAQTLELTPRGCVFGRGTFEAVFRDPRERFAVGDTVTMEALRVTVSAATPDGAPTRIEARADAPFEASALDVLRWDGERLVRVALPPVGARIELPYRRGPFE